MLKDKIKATGLVKFVLTDANGNVKEQHDHNLVVDVGLAYIASRMKDTTATAMSHMAVGTGTAAAADAQTALGTESARVALDSTTIVTTTVANDSIQYVATFSPGVATAAITEAGIFNASSSGTMLCRTKFDVINKGALDTLTITWKITVA
jgi:hypothetical protein